MLNFIMTVAIAGSRTEGMSILVTFISGHTQYILRSMEPGRHIALSEEKNSLLPDVGYIPIVLKKCVFSLHVGGKNKNNS